MIKDFLKKYDTVIFDMDGVITSEEKYWDAASLTVYQYLNNGEIDVKEAMNDKDNIRRAVFCNDETISVLKGKGVNSNWDLGYVTVLIGKIIGKTDYHKILDYAKTLSDNVLEEYDNLAKLVSKKEDKPFSYYMRNGEFWCNMRDSFQEWYLGDDEFLKAYGRNPEAPGKSGLCHAEKPIVDLNGLKTLIFELSKTHRLCTGTGRMYNEVEPPLKSWGIFDYFDKNGFANYNHVTAAEKELFATLTKPHPYMFLKALYGTDYSDRRIIDGDYDKEKIKKTLIVGDAGADILAAKAMGADFCAVLTGVKGKSAKGYFEELNAEYILDSVLDMLV